MKNERRKGSLFVQLFVHTTDVACVCDFALRSALRARKRNNKSLRTRIRSLWPLILLSGDTLSRFRLSLTETPLLFSFPLQPHTPSTIFFFFFPFPLVSSFFCPLASSVLAIQRPLFVDPRFLCCFIFGAVFSTITVEFKGAVLCSLITPVSLRIFLYEEM